MNGTQQVIQNNEDEIDLRELVLILWKQKVIIISLALIGTILAGIFSIFVLSRVYNTKLNVVISMPETYTTRYGDYKLPITTNDQYINLITSNDVLLNTIKGMKYQGINVDNLRSKISIGKVNSSGQNSFDITVSAGSSEESLKLANTLYQNYIEFLDVMIHERAISYYNDKFRVDLKTQEALLNSQKQILKKNEDLLAKMPETINQSDVKNQLPNTSNTTVLENIINPNYTELGKVIIDNKQTINTAEDAIRADKENISDLDKEKKEVDKYYQTGKAAKLESSLIGVVETSIYLPSPSVAPSHKTSPNNTTNVAIGFFLGGMIGALIAFCKEYWFKKS